MARRVLSLWNLRCFLGGHLVRMVSRSPAVAAARRTAGAGKDRGHQ